MANFVFLHGGGQGGWVWDETIAALTAQSGGAHRVLALDIPGCGKKRGQDTSAITFDAITAELIADIMAAGLRDVVLVGHSQAGTVLPRMAKARPELFARVVFVSCITPDPGLAILEMTQRLQGAGASLLQADDVPMMERFRAIFCNDMAPDFADAFLARLGLDAWPPSAYAERNWPYDHLADLLVSYVVCLQDAILPVEWQERFAERVYARQVVRIDAAHQVMNTRPQALAEVLLAQAPV